MNTFSAMAVFCGLLLGAGLWLVLVRMPFMRATPFLERIEPQLRSHNLESTLLQTSGHNITPFGPLERILRPLVEDGLHHLAKFNFGTTALNRRLARAGSRKTALDFRAEQLLWAAIGFVLAIVLTVFSATAGRFNLGLSLVSIVGATLGGFLFRDYVLGVQIKRRERRMLAEFPSLAELMALAVGAGESAIGALDRVCRTANGELAKEFALSWPPRGPGSPWSRRCRTFPRAQSWGRWCASSTAWLSPSNAARRWPKSSAPRHRTSATAPNGNSWSRPAARKSA